MRKSLVLILILTTCHFIGHAQLATYSFSGTGACPTQSNSGFTFSNGTATPFTRVGGLTCQTASNAFNSSGWSTASTVDNSQYIEVTINANAGYKLDLTSISISYLRSSTGASNIQVAHNGTGAFSTLSSIYSVSTTESTSIFDFTDFSTVSNGSLSFRIYGWGASSSTGTMRITNFQINGATTIVNNPLTVDYTNGRVGIGTAIPNYKLDVNYTDNNFNSGLNISNTSNGTQAITGITFKDSSSTITGSVFSTNSNYANIAQTNSFIAGSAGLKRLGIIANVNSISNTPQDIYFNTIGNDTNYKMIIKGSTGFVGIGTKTPFGKLHIKGNSDPTTSTFVFEGVNPGLQFWNSSDTSNDFQMGLASGTGAYTQFAQSGDFVLAKVNRYGNLFIGNQIGGNITFTTGQTGYGSESKAMTIYNNGTIGIGTNSLSDTSYKLYVEKGIRTRKVKVDLDTWADYVFAPAYKLLPLQDLETYIKTHHHLPDVPSTSDVSANGIDLGSNQTLLLKKIEELTLYIINQNKRITQLEQKLLKKTRLNK